MRSSRLGDMAKSNTTLCHHFRDVRYSVSGTGHRGFPGQLVCCVNAVVVSTRAVKDKPNWTELCRHVSVEQDPDKLMELIREITHLLDDKEERLRLERSKKG
jgi:serine phosphatase RsbU (regulator of sigma subunit)